MRIATYNVMSGGFSDYTSTASTPERLPLLQEAIKTLQADVIGLVDTYRWDQIYRPDDLCQLFGYRFAACINLNDDRLRKLGHNNGLTLLSQYELHDVQTLRLATRDALSAKVETENGSLQVVVLYLDDLSEDARLEQTEALLAQLDPSKPVILMGDFNTINPSDQTAASTVLGAFRKANPVILEKLNPILGEMQRGEVIRRFEQAGFIDEASESHPTFATPLFPAVVTGPFLRIDYVLASKAVQVSDIRVATDDVFQQASDHYPLAFTAKAIGNN